MSDAAAREQAIDPRASYVVTAPAGSGKTELLTQRYLALLASVDQAEHILAITFTRKAVAEMRERVFIALREAAALSPEELHTLPDYKQKTMQLATAALARDEQQQWNLLNNPGRLRIHTFDAFSASLVRQLPVSSRFGGSPQQSDEPQALYRQAIRRLFARAATAGELKDEFDRLIVHLDCNVDRLHDLLLSLLEKRDQWRPVFAELLQEEDSQTRLQHFLQVQTQGFLGTLQTALLPYSDRLCSLFNFASQNLAGEEPPLQLQCLPGTDSDSLRQWKLLADFLLTSTHTLRKTVNKRQGFPPRSAKPEYSADDFKLLMVEIAESDYDLRQMLEELRFLPALDALAAQQELSQAILAVMRHAMAHLELVFQQSQQVDFVATSMQALVALQQNSELAMRLDYRIQHILVDEFQDTSLLQYDLLKAVCQEWATDPQADKSLFIVGDAMQSIYSFRNARVGLFMRTREQGFAGQAMSLLTLQRNFRSHATVLNWINQSFARIFPKQDDIANNAAAFVRAESTDSDPNTLAEVRSFEFSLAAGNRQVESNQIVALIRSAQAADPTGSIAILVRNRNHLAELLPVLRSAGIPWQASDLEALVSQACVADLVSLTRLCLSPADQIAWFAVLRAPFLALSLPDLLCIGRYGDYSVAQAIERCLAAEGGLSTHGRQALQRFYQAYQLFYRQRHRKALHDDVLGLWTALGGPLMLNQPSDQEFVQLYLSALSQLPVDHGRSWEHIESSLQRMYANTARQDAAGVQIMTMHKAKGLEFDTVILPGLDRRPGADSTELISWHDPLGSDGEAGFLLGLYSPRADGNSMHDYTNYLKKRQQRNESARLLYVACTRAIKRLYLFRGFREKDGEALPSEKNSLAAIIWPTMPQDAELLQTGQDQAVEAQPSGQGQAERLSEAGWARASAENRRLLSQLVQEDAAGLVQNPPAVVETGLNTVYERAVGTVVHRTLEGIVKGDFKGVELARTAWKTQLRQSGLHHSLDQALGLVEQATVKALADKNNDWIFTRGDAGSDDLGAEVRLRTVENRQFRTLIVDRIVRDSQGQRWIIDYKVHQQQNVSESELRSLAESYRDQLQRYQNALQADRLGVYFVLQQLLVELEVC